MIRQRSLRLCDMPERSLILLKNSTGSLPGSRQPTRTSVKAELHLAAQEERIDKEQREIAVVFFDPTDAAAALCSKQVGDVR
jgi:hypothetical protein